MDIALMEVLHGRRPALDVRGRPSVARTAQRMAQRGALVSMLPGVYVRADRADDVPVRVAAAIAHDPDVIVAGRAAAAVSWWPELNVGRVDCIRAAHHQAPPGFRWQQRAIPDQLIADHGPIRLTTPALTVLDLMPELGGNVIDEALRRRAVTLPVLERALQLTEGRPGNGERRILLLDSRDEPWSPAERRLHRIFHSLPVALRYETNMRVVVDGRVVYLDLALPDLRLAFEVDGYAHHSDRAAFERDRERNSGLAALGWQIVNLSAAMVEHREPEVRERMLQIIRLRAALIGWPLD